MFNHQFCLHNIFVPCIFLVFVREMSDPNSPWQWACSQDIDYTEVAEAHPKAELLQDASDAAGSYLGGFLTTTVYSIMQQSVIAYVNKCTQFSKRDFTNVWKCIAKANHATHPDLVAPVQVIFPDDQILAVTCGRRSFILTIWNITSSTITYTQTNNTESIKKNDVKLRKQVDFRGTKDHRFGSPNNFLGSPLNWLL